MAENAGHKDTQPQKPTSTQHRWVTNTAGAIRKAREQHRRFMDSRQSEPQMPPIPTTYVLAKPAQTEKQSGLALLPEWLVRAGLSSWLILGVLAIVWVVIFATSKIVPVFIGVFLALVITAILHPIVKLYNKVLPRYPATFLGLLTVLGIVIGISAVIAMTALIDGIKYSLVSSLGLNQSRMVMIYAWPDREVTQQDLEMLQLSVPGYELVTGIDSTMARVNSAEKQFDARIIGCTPDYFTVMGLKASAGSLLTKSDVDDTSRNVLLDKLSAEKLFGSADASIGQVVRINNDSYTIAGVVDSGPNGGGQGDTLLAYMPYSTYSARLTGTKTISQVFGYARENVDMKALADETKSWLLDWFNIPSAQAEDRVTVMTLSSIIEQMNATLMSFQVLVTATASISLLVGGIGIMNMMLTNVTERIREIGLRKALGARASDITKQFLCESILICIMGGVIGIALGYAGAWGLAGSFSSMITLETGITPIITPNIVMITSGICIGIGLIFGYWPARRASKLNPVESLRYQ